MDYKARFFDAALGRFIQPDTITPGGPQGLNRFSYVLNNPVNATDPTGHMVCEEEEGCGVFGTQERKPTPIIPPDSSIIDKSMIDDQIVDKRNIYYLLDFCVRDPYNPGCPSLPINNNCYDIGGGMTVITSNVPYGCYITGYRTYYDKSKIDWGQFTMDSLGIITNLALFVGIFAPPALYVAGIADVSQVLQIGYDAIKMNSGAFSWDVFSTLSSETRLGGRLFPVINIPIIATSMTYNLHPSRTTIPILKPYMPPNGFYHYWSP